MPTPQAAWSCAASRLNTAISRPSNGCSNFTTPARQTRPSSKTSSRSTWKSRPKKPSRSSCIIPSATATPPKASRRWRKRWRRGRADPSRLMAAVPPTATCRSSTCSGGAGASWRPSAGPGSGRPSSRAPPRDRCGCGPGCSEPTCGSTPARSFAPPGYCSFSGAAGNRCAVTTFSPAPARALPAAARRQARPAAHLRQRRRG